MRKKVIITFISIVTVLVAFYGYTLYQEHGKIIPYIGQLSKAQVRDNVDVQPTSQKDATYVGSQKCKKCHEEQFTAWKASYHSKMIQDPHQNMAVIVGDFATLPKEANFKKEDVAFTIGGKFKQRYMLHKEINGTQDFVVGNYQWNTQTKQWQGYKTYKDWYENGFEHNNSTIGTSKTCDGCHFTGFMSQQKRTEPAISCESCHGPASKHVEEPEENHLYEASNSDPKRATEVCLQCHMRNRDKRMEHASMAALFGDVRDYPKGYEPGKPLHPYKMPAPFEGKETGEFYGNGVGKKNRTQGNEFVQSLMYQHGITCINCHDPHVLNSTTTKPLGDAVCMKCHTLGSAIGPHQTTLEEHTHHKADSNGSSCIECHMPKTSRHLPESPLTVRAHVFGFITPKETQKYAVPNACNNCHSDKSVEWADKTLDKWGMSQWVKQP
jgi:hypothetical protein